MPSAYFAVINWYNRKGGEHDERIIKKGCFDKIRVRF